MLNVDYLIVGGGAMGLIFADELLSACDASIAIVDRRPSPGGHWNDAYPFVRLHQPSAFYGAGSRPLGGDGIDTAGFNTGFYELASVHELTAYFHALLNERLLPSGRVHWLPASEHRGDGRVVDLATGAEQTVTCRRLVDATYFNTALPATHTPAFSVAPDVTLIPPNALPARMKDFSRYVILGAGKTAIDTLVWLLESRVDPATITWVAPRDSWLTNREMVQPGDAFFARRMTALAAGLEAAAAASDVEDLFERLEAAKVLLRVDTSRRPSMYRGAIISEAEIALLRRLPNIIRLGHVQALEAGRSVLDKGEAAIAPGALYIDCTARGFGAMAPRPVFEGDRITIQMVRANLTSFSAAAIARVEATYDDDAHKNHLCQPIPPALQDIDWLSQTLADLQTGARWASEPALRQWIAGHRLTGFGAWPPGSPEAAEIAARTRTARPLAQANLERLLARPALP